MNVTLKPPAEQVIVITGASSGIGLATARMAAEGATVGARGAQRGSAEGADRGDQGKRSPGTYMVADVGKNDEVAQVADTAIREFGRFDTWANNAGIAIFGQVWDVPLEDWHRMFATTAGASCTAPWRRRHYRERGDVGSIGSVFDQRTTPMQGTYSPANFAVRGFTDVLRMEVEHNDVPVSVSLIHHWRIDTPFNEHAGNTMPLQPVHHGTVYPLEAVAEAILWCAAHPKRDMYVGSQAKFASLLGTVAPRLTDKLFERIM